MRIRSWRCHPDFPAADESSYRGCWEYELQPGETTVPHQHEDGDEISIALEGCGQITVGDTTREIRPGEVVFIPARTNHSMRNDSMRPIRGLTIETRVKLLASVPEGESAVSVRDMEHVIEEIPEDLDESEALQLIIRLFDLAGRLSEQIEFAVGLESSTGLEALKNLEKRVMGAVVLISQNYENGPSFQHPRF
ncbi:MAG: cupin domain-containing protein [Planctomycetota bacterium]